MSIQNLYDFDETLSVCASTESPSNQNLQDPKRPYRHCKMNPYETSGLI